MMEQQLKVGSEVWLKLPYGDLFTRPHNKVNTVFIAGGTGITPFLSLFTHKYFNEYINPRIYLGFRSRAYNIYSRKLNMVKFRENFVKFRGFKIFYEDTDGRLDIQQILKENGLNPDYFISGPPVMIKVFKQTLIDQRVPINQILTDDWE
jgi:predicted ferric reductase